MNNIDITIKVTNLFNINFSECKLLGEGHFGKVYLIPNGKVIKVFKRELSCIKEYCIFDSVKHNEHFPKVYEFKENFLIREYVDGTCLIEYILKNGLSNELILNLIALIEDFKNLGFTMLDIQCKHIFIEQNEAVKVIDLRNHYTKEIPFPFFMIKGLRRLGVSDKFLFVLREVNLDLYNKWTNYML